MNRLRILKSALIGGASVLTLANPAAAKIFNIPDGDLAAALDAYMKQAGVEVIYSDDAVRGHRTQGARGNYSETAALDRVLAGTGFAAFSTSANAVGIVPEPQKTPERVAQAARRASAAPAAAAPAAVETVVVTAQKKSENIQNVPIAVTALSQAQLTERQIAGGPDLVKEVPNLTFSKTNFTGYNIQIRGIGTQAISVTTDPAVAVAFNGTPFIRNHFFEQEFYDLQDVEVLRGPQGTLYGRNATAGVVNVKSALPTDQFEAMASVDVGNYHNRRFEGMVNIPIVDDRVDLRIAGEWTKRDGYSFNQLTGSPIDGRDLWSGRVSLALKPTESLQATLVWEHFSEDDDRMRTAKQLCKTDIPPTSINGERVTPGGLSLTDAFELGSDYLSQGCAPTSLYSPAAFEVPYGFSLPYAVAIGVADLSTNIEPYVNTTQSRNLRVIESTINPHYQAKNDIIEFNADYAVTPSLNFASQTGYNQDFLSSFEDYNRFNTAPGIFADTYATPGGIFCDPQLGCTNRLVAEDLSNEHAWQLSQEFRLTSKFSGPLNFSFGGNYLHYETEENYYVFINSLTLFAVTESKGDGNRYHGIATDNHECLVRDSNFGHGWGYQYPNPIAGGGQPTSDCIYIDPNPITSLNNNGHNYFLSQNPYVLNSYAGFGEVYYSITNDLKLTGGLRWTEDRKRFIDIPSQVITRQYGYPITGLVNQQWDQLTGRAAVNWSPKLDFTDQTLIYGSYAHGYKAGGANPPGAILDVGSPNAPTISEPIHPLTFKPEFIDAYELGSKNITLDGALTLNGDIFYYNYKGYQISRIVDRTSINDNFNATVKGAELETSWEPAPGLKFSFAGGYEDTRIADGQSSIDLMDRTDAANHPGWMVVKPFVTQSSNCILPVYVVQALLQEHSARDQGDDPVASTAYACEEAYIEHLDPATLYPYTATPSAAGNSGYKGGILPFTVPAGYPGFDPTQPAINNGEGFAKNVGGNQLPNAPHFTTSLSAEYTLPVSENWAATLHGDFYWQSQSFARVFNDRPYDKLRGYSNVNLALILTGDSGWQVMGYVKNVFDVTAITGDFLNSDDSGLTTNVFLTDPRLFGVRVTKNFGEGDSGAVADIENWIADLFADKDGGRPPLWIELGVQTEHVAGRGELFSPGFLAANPDSPVLGSVTPLQAQRLPKFGFGEEGKISFQPDDSDWVFSAAIRYGRSGNVRHVHHQTRGFNTPSMTAANFADTVAFRREKHAILDFTASRDVGLGMFGKDSSSVVGVGVRFAQLSSNSAVDMRARPDLSFKYFTYGPNKIGFPYFHTYHATGRAKRSFHGVGPSLSWSNSASLAENLQDGEISIDWGVNAAVLFGKQRAHVRHQESGHNKSQAFNKYYTTLYPAVPHNRDTLRSVAVPNLGGTIGLSWSVKNFKVSFGYRADEFFGAMDGGIDTRKSENVGFFGPYANISIGLGG